MITYEDIVKLTLEVLEGDDGSGEAIKAYVSEAGVDPGAADRLSENISTAALEGVIAGEIPPENMLSSIALSAFVVGLKTASEALVKAAE